MQLAGYMLIAVAAGHLLLSARGTRQIWSRIAQARWWNTVRLEPVTGEEFVRSSAFWATAGSFGVPTLLLGASVVWASGHGLEPPAWLGWGLLGWGLIAAPVAAKGGFWQVIVPAVLLIAAAG